MQRLAALLAFLLVTGCATVPAAPPPAPPPPPPAPPLPAVQQLDWGELRTEEIPQDRIFILPTRPRVTARVRHTDRVEWRVHAAGMDPHPPLLATLQPKETEPGTWVLEWADPPKERVRLTLYAEVAPGYPDGPALVREGDRRWAPIASATVRALPPGTSPYISQERALELARHMDPKAFWTVRLVKDLEYEGKGGKQKRAAWVAEAVYRYGNRLVVAVDAVRGEQLYVMQAEAPHFPGPPSPIALEQAARAALAGASPNPETIGTGAVEFREAYLIERPPAAQHFDVWVVRLVNKADGRPAGRVVVHAYTGAVLDIAGPPSGQ